MTRRISKTFRLTREVLEILDRVSEDRGVNRHQALFGLVKDGAKVHWARRQGGRVVEEVDGVRTQI